MADRLRPPLPEATELDGTETFIGRQGGVLKRFMASMFRGQKGDKGDKGDKSTEPGPKGDPGTPKRIEVYASTASSTAGAAKVVFTTPFAAVPVVLPVITWAGTVMVTASPSNITKAGCDVTVMRSRGSLVLSAGPFETGPAGTVGTVVAFGS